MTAKDANDAKDAQENETEIVIPAQRAGIQPALFFLDTGLRQYDERSNLRRWR